jgi:hypothetical protein
MPDLAYRGQQRARGDELDAGEGQQPAQLGPTSTSSESPIDRRVAPYQPLQSPNAELSLR